MMKLIRTPGLNGETGSKIIPVEMVVSCYDRILTSMRGDKKQ